MSEEFTEEEQQYFDSKGDEGFTIENPEDDKPADREDEPEEAPEAEDKPEEKEEKVVPLAALHEERKRRQELQEAQRQLEEKTRLMEERFGQIQKGLEAPEPDFEEDPAAYLKHNDEKTAAELEELKQWKAQQEQASQHSAQEQQFINRYVAEARNYSQQNPDFGNAYNHWQNSVQSELHAMGYPPEQATQVLQNLEKDIAARAFNDGVNPAERVYELAKQRGYTVQEKKEQANLDNIEKGMKASKSLSSEGGGKTQQTTLEALADMSQEDFDAWMAKNPKSWQKLHTS